MLLYGINPVLEALRARRVTSIRVGERAGGRVADVMNAAERVGVPVRRVPSSELDRAAKGGVHQGVIADVADAARLDIDDLIGGAAGAPLLVVLDGIEDPHNVG